MAGFDPVARAVAFAGRKALRNSYYPDPTDASIRVAALTAITAGGGTVFLPAGPIPTTSPLPLGNNLRYKGVAPSWNMASGATTGGTILIGDGVANVSPGTFNCFELNPNDNAAFPASPSAMFATGLQGVEINDITFRGFKFAIKFGGFRSIGVHTLRMDNVIAAYCDWGFWLENCHNMHLGNIIAESCRSGHYYHGSSMGTIWHFGNDYVANLVIQGNPTFGLNGKGAVVEARGAYSQLNSVTYGKITAIGTTPQVVTVAAASVFTSGSPSIAIATNIDRFAIDNAIWFGTAGSGFTLRPYFVVARTDNGDGSGTIQVSGSEGGTPVNATSNTTTTTVKTAGATLLKIGCKGDSTVGNGGPNGLIDNSSFLDLDLEAGGLGLLLQGVRGGKFRTSICNAAGPSICVTDAWHDTVIDLGVQVGNFFCYPGLTVNLTGIVPSSYWPTSGRTYGLMNRGFSTGLRLDLTARDSSNVGDLYAGPAAWPGPVFGMTVTFRHFQSPANDSLDVFRGNAIVHPGGTITLPTIIDGNLGTFYVVSNPTAAAATLSTAASQTFDNDAGVTTYSIPSHRAVTVMAFKAGGTYYWGVTPGRP